MYLDPDSSKKLSEKWLKMIDKYDVPKLTDFTRVKKPYCFIHYPKIVLSALKKPLVPCSVSDSKRGLRYYNTENIYGICGQL